MSDRAAEPTRIQTVRGIASNGNANGLQDHVDQMRTAKLYALLSGSCFRVVWELAPLNAERRSNPRRYWTCSGGLAGVSYVLRLSET